MYKNCAIDKKSFHDFLDGNGPVPAHRHSYGNGWVADTAKVADTAYVGPQARVFGNASVLEQARICDYAEVSGHSTVRGNARLCGTSKVQGSALVEDGVVLESDCFIGTNIHLKGSIHIGDHMTLVNFRSCLNCPFMPDDTYGAGGDNPCLNCLSGIMKRNISAQSGENSANDA